MFSTAIVIGFLNSEINSISEKEGNISVLFGVVSGTLGLALNVEVTTVDESTKGLKYYFMKVKDNCDTLQEISLVCL